VSRASQGRSGLMAMTGLQRFIELIIVRIEILSCAGVRLFVLELF
jgi:hypothetical protein